MKFEKLHKRIKIVCLIFLLLGIASLVYFFIDGNTYDLAPALSFILFAFIAYISSFAMFNKDKLWINKISKYFLIFFPLTATVLVFLSVSSTNIFVILLLGSILFMYSTIAFLKLFLYNKATSSLSILVFLFFVIVAILFKKFHFPLAGILLTASNFCIAIGMIIFGIRCLYIIENNIYFRNLSFFVSMLVSVTFMGILFKIMHWPLGGFFITTSNILMITGSIVILFSIPYSGYIDWPKLHKKILGKLLYPWIFIFLLFLFKQLAPGAWNNFWGATANEEKVHPGFEMVDYPIENKNGLE